MPLICVGPVRSHIWPTITSFCCAAALPARPSPAVAPAVSASATRDNLLILRLLDWLPLEELASSLRLLDRRGYDFRITAEPVGLLDEFAALDLENLHPATALVILGGDLERRKEPAQGEVVDLLEALLDVLAGRLAATRCFDRIADRFDMQRRVEDCTVVDDRVVHPLWRLLALHLVHRLDFLADGIVVAGSGELQRVIALRHCPATGRQDIGLGRGPDEAHHLRQRIAGALVLLDRHGGGAAEQMIDDEIGPV